MRILKKGNMKLNKIILITSLISLLFKQNFSMLPVATTQEEKDKLGQELIKATIFEEIKVGYLIQLGANIDAKDNNGLTALMIAAREGKNKIADLLMYKGADISLKDKDGKTALDYAKLNNQEEIIKLITKYKQKEIKENKIKLFAAIQAGNLYGIRELVKKVTLNVHDEKGNNPLHAALNISIKDEKNDAKKQANIDNKIKIIKLIINSLLITGNLEKFLNEKNNEGKAARDLLPANPEILEIIMGLKKEKEKLEDTCNLKRKKENIDEKNNKKIKLEELD